MAGPVVSLVKFTAPYDSLREALELCDGLKGWNASEKILIKPNIVEWDYELPFSPFGVVTTSAVMFALVKILAEAGFHNLTIAEGTPLPYTKGKGHAVYKTLGYDKLKEHYGVELVDIDEEKFGEVEFGDFKLSIAKRALEADKIITVPVLKTHNVCVLSLGIKNLKGLIDRRSKKFCHHVEIDLDTTYPRLMEKLPVALNVIDGVFALERGPFLIGKAHRKDLIIASTDVYACDAVGAELLGYGINDVPHLKYYSGHCGRSIDLDGIEIKGEEAGKHKEHLAWEWEWTKDDTGPLAFEKIGVTGLVMRKSDSTLCTGCTELVNPILTILMGAKNKHFGGIEILTGKKMLASPGFEKTILFGKCISDLNKGNPNIKKAIAFRTCPPDVKKFEKVMREEGIECDFNDYVKFRHFLYGRYKDKQVFDLGLYSG